MVPDFGYRLNMGKSICLISPPRDGPLSEDQLELRVLQLEELGIPRSNIKIRPKCQDACSSSLFSAREEQFFFKVLGAYVGLSKYVAANLDDKLLKLQLITEALLKFPNGQGRYNLHRFSLNPRINYLLRTQFPEHTKRLVSDFKRLQMKLISSYHGITAEDDFRITHAQDAHLYDRASLPICKGSLSLK